MEEPSSVVKPEEGTIVQEVAEEEQVKTPPEQTYSVQESDQQS